MGHGGGLDGHERLTARGDGLRNVGEMRLRTGGVDPDGAHGSGGV